MAKEYAGQERAQGTGPFTLNSWQNLAAFEAFLGSVVMQESLFSVFDIIVMNTPRGLPDRELVIESEAAALAELWRGYALVWNNTGLETVAPNEWTSVMTDKINLMREVSVDLCDELLNQALDGTRHAWRLLTVAIVLNAVLVLAWLPASVCLLFRVQQIVKSDATYQPGEV